MLNKFYSSTSSYFPTDCDWRREIRAIFCYVFLYLFDSTSWLANDVLHIWRLHNMITFHSCQVSNTLHFIFSLQNLKIYDTSSDIWCWSLYEMELQYSLQNKSMASFTMIRRQHSWKSLSKYQWQQYQIWTLVKFWEMCDAKSFFLHSLIHNPAFSTIR